LPYQARTFTTAPSMTVVSAESKIAEQDESTIGARV
jgi:hypothetical protein